VKGGEKTVRFSVIAEEKRRGAEEKLGFAVEVEESAVEKW
jgi:hypothetical protein